jgi:hypothetical protein
MFNLFKKYYLNLFFKTLTIGLRIAASKDQIVMNTATAMLSQMVTKVFERVLIENKAKPNEAVSKQFDIDQLKTLSKDPPSWMNESGQDAYMLLQVESFFYNKCLNIFNNYSKYLKRIFICY